MNSPGDDLFDPRIADWLEDDPNHAPGQVTETILAAFPSIPQRRAMRAPWRPFTMTRFAPLAAGIAAVAVILVGGILFLRPGPAPGVGATSPSASGSPSGSPSPSTSPSTSPSPSTALPDYTGLLGWIVFEHFKGAPDGSTAFGADYPRGLWLVHADGSGLHELAPGAPAAGKINPDISPDGTKVAFASFDEPVRIWEVGIEGGTPRLLSTDCSGKATECMEGSPSYSPDGGRIALIRGTDRTTVLAIRDLGTGHLTVLESTRTTNTKTDEVLIDQPTWSPDGTQVAYYRVTHDLKTDTFTDSRILIVNADGTGLHELSLPAGTPWGDPDWSPDGSRIVLSSYPIHEFNTGRVAVYSVNPDGTDLRRLTPDGDLGYGAPTWTSDGQHIIFWGYRTFWMMDPDGGHIGPINEPKLTYYGPVLGYGYYGLLQPTQ